MNFPRFLRNSLIALIWLTLASMLHAAWTEQVVSRRGSRARVLVLSENIDTTALQKAFDDTANIWVATPPTEKDAAKESLKNYLGKRPWDIVIVDPAFRNLYERQKETTPAKQQAAFLRQVRDFSQYMIATQSVQGAPTDANTRVCKNSNPDTLQAALKAFLYANSVPAATAPKGAPDPALLLTKEAATALNDPATLPLLKTYQAEIYHAKAGELQFNMHPFIRFFDGKFWVIWSTGPVDEDGAGQFIRYATSQDGLTWSLPETLVATPKGEQPDGKWRWMPGGLYVENGKLYALAALFFGSDAKAHPRVIWKDLKTYRFEWTGKTWENKGVFADDCLVYFPPWEMKDGARVMVWRDKHGHFYTARITADGVIASRTALPGPLPDYRMSETSAFVDDNGAVHLIIRDQGYTYRIYRAVSFDNGRTWTEPQKTNYPDAVSKNLSGKLSNGWYYLINNPGKGRDPLSIAFSPDGWTFGNPANIRIGAPARRYPGKFKNDLSFQYADAVEHDGVLWVVYAVNKEDIEIRGIALKDMPIPR